MQTLSLFSSTPLFTNKQAPTFKASSVSEAGITPLPAPRLQHDTVSFAPKIRSGELSHTARGIINSVVQPYQSLPEFSLDDKKGLKQLLRSELIQDETLPHQLTLPNLSLQQLPPIYSADSPLALKEPTPELTVLIRKLEDIRKLSPSFDPLGMFQMCFGEMRGKGLADLYALLLQTESKEALARALNSEVKENDVHFVPAQQFRNSHASWVKSVEEAEEKVKVEQAMDIFFQGWDAFADVAKRQHFVELFDQNVRDKFRKMDIELPFHSRSLDSQKRFEKYFRNNPKSMPNMVKFPWSTTEHPLFDPYLDGYSVKRLLNVTKVLSYLETCPKEVDLVLQKLKGVKP